MVIKIRCQHIGKPAFALKLVSGEGAGEFVAGGVSAPLIHCCAGLTRWVSQRDRLHLISYKWKHKLVPVQLSKCVVFIFIDQTAKFVCEPCVTDVAIKAEL